MSEPRITPAPDNAAPGTLDYAAPPRRIADNLATAAAVAAASAILSLFLLGSQRTVLFLLSIPLALAAIVMGTISLGNSKREGLPHRTEARVACWIGGILLSLWLAAFMVSSPGGASVRVNRVKCSSNLKQIGTGLIYYASTHNGIFPCDLGTLITHADCTSEIFNCPSSNTETAVGPTSQATAAAFRAKQALHNSYVFVTPSVPWSTLSGDAVLAYELLANHENEGINILFADGQVDWIPKNTAATAISELAAGKNPPPSLSSK